MVVPALKLGCPPHGAAPDPAELCREQLLAVLGRVLAGSTKGLSRGWSILPGRPWRGGCRAGAGAAWLKTVSSSSGRGAGAIMDTRTTMARFGSRVGQPHAGTRRS